MSTGLVLQLHIQSFFAMASSRNGLVDLPPSGPGPDECGMAPRCEYELCDEPPNFRRGEKSFKDKGYAACWFGRVLSRSANAP